MKKKITEKDKKDWLNFINNNEKLSNKDSHQIKNQNIDKVIDLHGFSLENANKTIDEYIKFCFLKKVSKINVITGKGSRSKNKDNPYQSENFGILKHSVPEYIKTNQNLMKMIKEINFEDIKNPSKGSFDILLKKNNK